MSKKVLGFTSRKWTAFWLGCLVGAVVAGLAVCRGGGLGRTGLGSGAAGAVVSSHGALVDPARVCGPK